MNNKIRCFHALVILLIFTISVDAGDNKIFKDICVSPVLMTDDISKIGIGAEYKSEVSLFSKSFSSSDTNSLSINPDALVGSIDLKLNLDGTISIEKETNPKNFLESKLSCNYLLSSTYFTIKAGLFCHNESDQSFENTQYVYGINAALGKIDFPFENDLFSAYFNYGQIDPKGDKDRQLILGDNLEKYYRWNIELLYNYNIGKYIFDNLEFNYRIFNEVGANQQIKDTDLSRFQLITFRLGFKHNLFIAYSHGKLPFDKEDDQIIEAGFSYKFIK